MTPSVTYYTIPAPASVSAFVRMFWVYEMEREATPYIYRSMADGCAEMVFHYRGAFDEVTDNGIITQGAAMLHAQSKGYRRFVTQGSFGIFGVYLYPFAIPHLFNIASIDASDEMPDLQTLMGNEGRDLEEQMMLAKDNVDRVHILSAFLEQRLKHIQVKDDAALHAVRHVIHSKDALSVNDLAYRFNISERQLERRFKDYAGFSPKVYSRINRFQAALKHYNNSKSLTDIAYECGYYDQAHFIHDFKGFSGYHPKTYFKGVAEGMEYLQA